MAPFLQGESRIAETAEENERGVREEISRKKKKERKEICYSEEIPVNGNDSEHGLNCGI